jgi:D-serine deaminase-like pyridoxal phosphate-dependent protein
MVHRGVYGLEDCALTILATVVSTPTPNRAIIDAGSKVLSSDLLGLDGYGYIKGHPDLRIRNIAEEHGTIIHENGATELTVGDRLEIIPNHCCVVSNLVGVVTFVSGGKVTSTVPVEARGKIT